MSSPARAALLSAGEAAARSGHEHRGPVSLSHGFLPTRPPLLRFGERHAAWDAVVAELPELHASLLLRRRLEALPELPADSRSLPSRYLQRAATALGILAHAYHRVGPRHSGETPLAVRRPWEQVSRRLGRRAAFLTYTDLIVCNWRNVGPDGCGLTVEDLQLLVPTVDTPEERVFYLTQVEMLWVGAPLIGAAVRAQEAMLSGDLAALARELEGVSACLRRLIRASLPKINPNRYADTYVDPAVWAKTVAPLAVPLKPGPPGPSGTSSPLFHLLDALLGRRRYDSQLGMEARTLRAIFPPHWAAFLEGVAAHSVADYVAQHGDGAVRDAFADALDAYAGEDGLLERHRRKVYGYIELAFKLGRSLTIGGFSGVFRDRAWEPLDAALVASRVERLDPRASNVRRVPVLEVGAAAAASASRVRSVVLGTADANLDPEPGDRLRVYPEQPADAVSRTLRVLGASGAEAVRLDGRWRRFAGVVLHEPSLERLALRDLLRQGELGPADARVAATLRALAVGARQRHVLARGAEHRWPLPELLSRLDAADWDSRILLAARAGRHHAICDVVPPAAPRTYSVASAVDHRLTLTVGRLEGEAPEDGCWSGLASRDLTRSPADRRGPLAVSPLAAVSFRPPADPRTPLVMVAGGTGVSPFRSFILHRAAQPMCGEMWLLLGARHRSEACYLDELERLTATVPLEVRLALSREHGRRLDTLLLDDEIASQLWRMLREPAEGGAGAVMYVCGSPGVAATAAESVRAIFRRHEPIPAADRRFRRLVGRRRYLEEVFAVPASPAAAAKRRIPVSELVLHAAHAPQPWIGLYGRVYDITDFRHLHPGGRPLLDGYAGIDATQAFERVGHDRAPEIMARLATYELGRLLRPSPLTPPTSPAPTDTYDAWVRTLYLSVELANALRTDGAIRHSRTTAARPPGDLTPHKVQLAIDAHERFGRNVIDDLLGAPLDGLRDVTARLCAEPINRAPGRAVVPASAPLLFAALDHAVAGDQADTRRHADRACQALLAADRDLLRAVTSRLRAGVQVLERAAGRPTPADRAELLTILNNVFASLRAYSDLVQRVIDDLRRTGTAAGVVASSPVRGA